MARLFISVSWEGEERTDPALRDMILEMLDRGLPGAYKTGWSGFPEDLRNTELRVDDVWKSLVGLPNRKGENAFAGYIG